MLKLRTYFCTETISGKFLFFFFFLFSFLLSFYVVEGSLSRLILVRKELIFRLCVPEGMKYLGMYGKTAEKLKRNSIFPPWRWAETLDSVLHLDFS